MFYNLQNMNVWRPSKMIRVKALGLVWRDNTLLASEILNDAGDVKGVRPLGGTVEFGETWQNALKREFLEELGAEIVLAGPPIVLENIYSHHNEIGHEVIFLSNAVFVDKALYLRDEMLFSEDNGMLYKARWFNLSDLAMKAPELYPNGLCEKLQNEFKRDKE